MLNLLFRRKFERKAGKRMYWEWHSIVCNPVMCLRTGRSWRDSGKILSGKVYGGLRMKIIRNFAEYNQQDAKFLNLFISVRRYTCFRRFFRPSSGAQKCTYSVRYWSDKYLTLYVQFWAPDDGRKNCLKHVERLKGINKLRNVTSWWLYSGNILAMHGSTNVKFENN